jgi:hypothetical protein
MATTIKEIPVQIEKPTLPMSNGNGTHTNAIIRRYLPDASDSQIQRYGDLLKQLAHVRNFWAQYPEDKVGYEHLLARAEKALDYKRPYRIAIIGTTGVGKSTLINALLGRRLVVVKDVGKPATGAALEIFLDAKEQNEEYAKVKYRTESNIQALVAEFLQRFDIDPTQLPDSLDQSYVRQLTNIESGDQLGEQSQQEFEGLRQSLLDIVNQFLTVNVNTLLTDYRLNNPQHVEDLLALTDENSRLNSSPGRCIGLVQSVAYHIHPAKNDANLQTLQLPANVCLVDLPGLDGSPLHDIIISEGIKEADAVVFILRPPRILNRGDAYLLNRIRKYISLDGALDSAERIFLALNAIDDITRDNYRQLDNLPRDMHELMELISPGYASRFARRGGDQPYFMTSAWTALQAQQSLQGHALTDPQTYRAKGVKLGVDANDHAAMLRASQFPQLTQALNEFARNYRIEGQLREGKQALERITSSLNETYSSEIKLLTGGRGVSFIKTEDGRLLKERQENLTNMIIDFRLRQLEQLPQLRENLRTEASRLCDQIDQRLREDLPRLWKRLFVTDHYRPRARRYGKAMYEVFLGEVELLLWRQLAIRVQSLSDMITFNYRDAFERSRLTRSIVSLGYDHPLATQATVGLENISQDMKRSLNNLAERLALVYMLEPKAGFIPPDELDSPKKLTSNALIQALNAVPREREVVAEAFNEFVVAVRTHYQPAVTNYAVDALLNIYQYEMLVMEDGLLARVEELFSDLRETLPQDPLLREKVHHDAPDEDRDRIELLDYKQSRLAEAMNHKQV